MTRTPTLPLDPAIWVVGGQIYAKVISFVSYFVMVRYMTPEDVGLVALCWLSIAIGDAFFDVGLSHAYVRDGQRGQRAESTLFWAGAVLALIWTLLSFLAGPLLARLFDVPQVATAMAALTAIFAFKALGNAQISIQIVERRVAGIALRDAIAATAGAIVGITLAVQGYGAWALIARLICLPAVTSLLAMTSTRWRPTLAFDAAWLREKLAFAVPLTAASNVHWLVVLQVEGYLVSQTLGLHALGLLQFAKKPTEVMSQLMNAVQRYHLLRELSAARDGAGSWRDALRREYRRYAVLGGMALLASLAFAFAVIEPVWGEQWADAVPLVAILALAAPLLTVQAVAVSGLVALGALGSLFRANLAGALITCIALWIGAQLGLSALGWALSASLIVAALIALVTLRRHRPAGPASGQSTTVDAV